MILTTSDLRWMDEQRRRVATRAQPGGEAQSLAVATAPAATLADSAAGNAGGGAPLPAA